MSMPMLSAPFDDGTTYVTQSSNGMRSMFSEESVVSYNASCFVWIRNTKNVICYCLIS
jgi:hypothetical protein